MLLLHWQNWGQLVKIKGYISGIFYVSKLSKKFLFGFNLVLSALYSFKENSITCTTNLPSPSYLWHCWLWQVILNYMSRLCYKKHFNNDKVVLALRPTGNSANLISGRTVYDFFKMRMSRKSIKDESLPDGIVGEVTQRNCLYLQALIVDERSLVGTTSLGWMEYHCRFGFGNLQQSWGGLPVVIFPWG